MHFVTSHRLYMLGYALLLVSMLLLSGMLPHVERVTCTDQPPGEQTCRSEPILNGMPSSSQLAYAGAGAALALFAWGVQLGGRRSLFSFVMSAVGVTRLRRRSGLLGTIMSGVGRDGGGGGADSMLPRRADPSNPDAFHQHRMSRVDADGQIGWWIEIPASAGELQVRLQSTPATPLNLQVAVDGAWVDTAGPARMIVHRLTVRPGQIWIRASLATPDGSTPLVELWLHPAPGASAAVLPTLAA